MTTSANAVFDPTRDELITTALQQLGVLNAEQEPDAAQVAMASRFLNLILKALANEGVSVRVRERVTVAIISGTSTITPSTDTEDVYVVTLKDANGFDRELGQLALDEYQRLNNKTISGAPTQFMFNKANGTALITLWPVNDGTAVSAEYQRIRRIRDMDAGDVTLDLPQAWHLAVSLKLAWMLAPHFNMLDKAAFFQTAFVAERESANMADTETGPLRFVVGEGSY